MWGRDVKVASRSAYASGADALRLANKLLIFFCWLRRRVSLENFGQVFFVVFRDLLEAGQLPQSQEPRAEDGLVAVEQPIAEFGERFFRQRAGAIDNDAGGKLLRFDDHPETLIAARFAALVALQGNPIDYGRFHRAIHYLIQRFRGIGAGANFGQEVLRRALATFLTTPLQKQVAVTFAAARHVHSLFFQIIKILDLAVGANDQISVEVLVLIHGDDERLELGEFLPGPRKLEAVEDAEMKILIDELLSQLVDLGDLLQMADHAGLRVQQGAERLGHRFEKAIGHIVKQAAYHANLNRRRRLPDLLCLAADERQQAGQRNGQHHQAELLHHGPPGSM